MHERKIAPVDPRWTPGGTDWPGARQERAKALRETLHLLFAGALFLIVFAMSGYIMGNQHEPTRADAETTVIPVAL